MLQQTSRLWSSRRWLLKLLISQIHQQSVTLNFKLPLTLSYLAEAPEKRNCMSGLPIGMLKKFYLKFSVELETGGKVALFAGMCREGSGFVFRIICAMKCPIGDCCATWILSKEMTIPVPLAVTVTRGLLLAACMYYQRRCSLIFKFGSKR
jgi:hypothetical protein